ncbi:MAG: hypothetical protein WAM70_11615 [Pyrinomonadaceae bacterium]
MLGSIMDDEQFERRKRFIIERRKKFREGMKELRRLQKLGDDRLKTLKRRIRVVQLQVDRLERS